jgi:hypothetical protein
MEIEIAKYLDQVSDAVGEHPRLSRSRTCNQHAGSFGIDYLFELGGIQVVGIVHAKKFGKLTRPT